MSPDEPSDSRADTTSAILWLLGLLRGRICDVLLINEAASAPGGRATRTLLVLDAESTAAREQFGDVYRLASRSHR